MQSLWVPACGQAADVLSDMVLHSAFDPEEMKKEKGVVTEEILMVEDSPEDLAMDLLSETFFGKSPLGSPILGTKETVQSFTREGILNYMARHYEPANMLVAVAGDFDEQEITDCVNELFGSSSQPFPVENYPAPPAPSGKRISLREKDIEQTHVTLATPGVQRRGPAFLSSFGAQQRPRRNDEFPSLPENPGREGPCLLGVLFCLLLSGYGHAGLLCRYQCGTGQDCS